MDPVKWMRNDEKYPEKAVEKSSQIKPSLMVSGVCQGGLLIEVLTLPRLNLIFEGIAKNYMTFVF